MKKREYPRTMDAVQWMHDLLHEYVTGEHGFEREWTTPESYITVGMLFACCWVLNHPAGIEFAQDVVNEGLDHLKQEDLGFPPCPA